MFEGIDYITIDYRDHEMFKEYDSLFGPIRSMNQFIEDFNTRVQPVLNFKRNYDNPWVFYVTLLNEEIK